MDLNRLKQTIVFAWKDSEYYAKNNNWKFHKRLLVYIDVLFCFFYYKMKSKEYFANAFYSLDKRMKRNKGLEYLTINKKREEYYTEYFINKRFLSKYSSLKYDNSIILQDKRNKAYKVQYNLGDKCWVHSGVHFQKEHFSDQSMVVGNNVIFGRNIDVDYTGGLCIGNDVSIAESVKILTHDHAYLSIVADSSKNYLGDTIYTPLEIQDNVLLGSRVIICPGVIQIGRKSILSVGAVVKKRVFPYSIVSGNPAKIIGFTMRPDEAYQYECSNYPEGQRISLETLQKNYKKYFEDRLDEIKKYTRI